MQCTWSLNLNKNVGSHIERETLESYFQNDSKGTNEIDFGRSVSTGFDFGGF